jgi:dihydrofolate reductase
MRSGVSPQPQSSQVGRLRLTTAATTYAAKAAHRPGDSGPFAKPMNQIPKIVFSHSLTSADRGDTTIAAGDLAEAITRLKQERSDGYLLAHGGTRFARSLVETGLIDEYRLHVHPVILGAGERIFLAPLTIEPMSTTVFDCLPAQRRQKRRRWRHLRALGRCRVTHESHPRTSARWFALTAAVADVDRQDGHVLDRTAGRWPNGGNGTSTAPFLQGSERRGSRVETW